MHNALWTPYVGAVCLHARTHCPGVLKPIAGPVRVVRLASDRACWVKPLGPVRTRLLRNGRTVTDTPNYEALVGNDQLDPLPADQAGAAVSGQEATT